VDVRGQELDQQRRAACVQIRSPTGLAAGCDLRGRDYDIKQRGVVVLDPFREQHRSCLIDHETMMSSFARIDSYLERRHFQSPLLRNHSLAGAAPLGASSGQRTRHCLNRVGDRTLNRALHTIAITRIRCHAETRAYEARRTLQGKTHREIRRCLIRRLPGTYTASWKPRQPLIRFPRRIDKPYRRPRPRRPPPSTTAPRRDRRLAP